MKRCDRERVPLPDKPGGSSGHEAAVHGEASHDVILQQHIAIAFRPSNMEIYRAALYEDLIRNSLHSGPASSDER